MNYYVKKDLSTIVRAKKGNTVAFATQQALTPPALKREGYIVEHTSITTPGLITRSFMNPFEFTRDYYEIDLSTFDMINLGALITSFGAADVARPTVASTAPANAATLVAKDATVSITFNEEIQVIGTMKAAFYHMVNGTLTKIEDATTMTVGGAGDKTLTIGHSAFLNEEVITCVLPADSVEDASANTNNYNTAYTFRFTTIPALTMASVPLDNALGVDRTSNAVLTYINALNDATSTFALTVTAGGAAVASTVTYDEAKKVVTVTPDATLTAETEFTLTCNAVDATGQTLETIITFTTAA